MEVLGVLLIPLVLAYMVAPIAAFFMALGNRKMLGELNLRLNALSQRLVDIERRQGPAAPHLYCPRMKTLYRAARVYPFAHRATGEWVLVDGRHVERVGSGEPPAADLTER